MSLYSEKFMASSLPGCFSDTALLKGILYFEAGLAKALAATELIDQESAQVIRSYCQPNRIDAAALMQAAGLAGNLAIPLVKQLTAIVAPRSPEAAHYFHWGATSQDVIDSGLMLQLRAACDHTASLLNRLIAVLTIQCQRYRATLIVVRTWLQHALPVTLGLKLAGPSSSLLPPGSRNATEFIVGAVRG